MTPYANYAPKTIHWPFDLWPDVPRGGSVVEFRLIYDGKLPAASKADTKNRDKDRIRRVFSKQLRELYETHPSLKSFNKKGHTSENLDHDVVDCVREFVKPGISYSMIDLMAARYERCGVRYLPMITDSFSIACSLDILFLRRDQPGNLIMSGGDLDNRIKVLFDALRLPQNCDEVLRPKDGEADDPVFVLLEDDRLIVDVKVTSDRLLTPRLDGEHINDVRLVIHVRTVVTDSSRMGAILWG